MTRTTLTGLDRMLVELERALVTVFDPHPAANRPSPSVGVDAGELDERERRHAGALMRINHVG
ncbi:MAG: demethoxyubiquinone hydroxylase family protein, partial [Dokdonella sp.]